MQIDYHLVWLVLSFISLIIGRYQNIMPPIFVSYNLILIRKNDIIVITLQNGSKIRSIFFDIRKSQAQSWINAQNSQRIIV